MTALLKQTFLVVDDHAAIVSSTKDTLLKEYPQAEVLTANTVQTARALLETAHPQLTVTDLCMPLACEFSESTDAGIEFIQELLQKYPMLNIVVQTAYPKSLIRLKSDITQHKAGFAVAQKSLTLDEFLSRVKVSLQEATYTPKEMRPQLELTHEQMELLQLAFQEGLQDKAIAEKMHVSERTVRNHWTKIQNALDLYPESGKNMRILTQIRAREEGLIN